jgi:hypothetical protein
MGVRSAKSGADLSLIISEAELIFDEAVFGGFC